MIERWQQFLMILMGASLALVSALEPAQARRGKRYAVKEPIRSELNRILDTANHLHLALFQDNEESLESSIDQMISLIENAEEKVLVSLDVRGQHILRVLHSLRDHLNLTKEYSGERRSEKLKSVFSEVVQIATNYHLNSYRVFFCDKDRTVWLQKGWKAQHPFDRVHLKHCGSAVR